MIAGSARLKPFCFVSLGAEGACGIFLCRARKRWLEVFLFIAAGLGYVYEEGGVYGMGKGSDIDRPHRE